MTNELQCLTTQDVCQLLRISTGTLYKRILRDPDHPVSRARIGTLKPYRFKRVMILEYIGAHQEQ